MSGDRLDLGAFAGLEGDRVILRRFTPGDITPDYIGWLNDRVVTRYSSQRFCTHTRASCEAYLARFAGSPDLFVAMWAKPTGRAIGTMTAYAQPLHGTCDVGIMIGERDHWGGGYGQEAWNLLTGWLLREAGVRKLTAGCLGANGAMIALMERSGMKREAVRAAHEVFEGSPCDVVHYARFGDG